MEPLTPDVALFFLVSNRPSQFVIKGKKKRKRNRLEIVQILHKIATPASENAHVVDEALHQLRVLVRLVLHSAALLVDEDIR